MHPVSLLFLLFPLLELWLLILAGRAVGALAIILWVILSAVIGLAALQRAGWKSWLRVDWRLRRGESPAAELADGVLLGTGGFLLFLPGLLTDTLGLLLLLPATRRRVVGALARVASTSRWAGFQAQARARRNRHGDDGVTLEGEYWRDDSQPANDRHADDRRLP
jgi:UPF0716 protein FxsA